MESTPEFTHHQGLVACLTAHRHATGGSGQPAILGVLPSPIGTVQVQVSWFGKNALSRDETAATWELSARPVAPACQLWERRTAIEYRVLQYVRRTQKCSLQRPGGT
jgi:hypothetical protein